MSEQPVNTNQGVAPEERKGLLESVGVIGGAAAVVGGVGAGAVADALAVGYSVQENLAKPYVDAMKTHAAGVTTADLFTNKSALQIPADFFNGIDLSTATSDHLMTSAEDIFWAAKEKTHEAIKAGAAANNAEQPVKDLFAKDTLLGKARRAADDRWKAANYSNETDEMKGFVAKWETQVNKIVAAKDASGKKTAAEELLKTVMEDAEASHGARIGEKVKEITWLSRLNLFNKELHLSSPQKGVAFAATAFTAIVGVVGIGMVASWLNSGKGPEK